MNYDPSLSQVLMTLAAICYEGENPLPKEPLAHQQQRIATMVQAELANKSYATEGLWELAWGPGLTVGNMMFLARQTGTDTYALAIRGTDWKFFIDWVEDADILNLVPFPYATTCDPNVRIARGTMDGLSDLAGMTAIPPTLPAGGPPTAVNLLQFLSDAASQSTRKAINVYVTGHSLGGALASVTGPWLQYLTSPWQHTGGTAVNVEVYTFAGPTAGNAGFSQYCAETFPNAFHRVFNEFDVIPRAWQQLVVMSEWYKPSPDCPPPFGLAARALAEIITGDTYTQAGVDQPLPGTVNDACARSFWDQLAFQHQPETYLMLVGAPPVEIEEQTVVTRSATGLSAFVDKLRSAAFNQTPPPPVEATED